MTDNPRPVAAIIADLRSLDVRSGDMLMVHASLRRLGPVEGGGAAVIQALEAATGPDGTLMMVLGARNDWDWVNDRPEAERVALLADAEPFDAWTTPAEADVGMLAEIFRRETGTVVSDHPEGRFGARGRLAHELVRDVPWDDYYGSGSPLERFVESGGRVLRLGANIDTVTVLHYAEYLAEVPEKRGVRRHRRVRTPTGSEIRSIDSLDDSYGIVDYDGPDYFAVILREYLATGSARTGTVGNAVSELIDAADLVGFGAAWMSANLGR